MFVDIGMLVDTVAIQKPTGETDRYDNEVLAEPIKLRFVRFDKSNSEIGTANNKEKQKVSVLYVYPRYTANAPDFDSGWLNGIVTCRGDEYIIKNVIANSEAFSSKIFSYEIEVI
jgi:hypothetical protein